MALLGWPLQYLVLCGLPLLISLYWIIKASYPSIHKWISKQCEKARDKSLYLKYIDRMLRSLEIASLSYYRSRRLPTKARCESANNMASAYEEFEWWVRSCYMQPTKQECDYILEQSGLVYKTRIAESLWQDKKIWFCTELNRFLRCREQALFEFSHTLAGISGDLDIEDAKNQLLKEYECLYKDVTNFHALGWAQILEDHIHPYVRKTLLDTWVKAQVVEVKWLYEESVGKSGLGPEHVPESYEAWSQSYTAKWWTAEWAKDGSTAERPNV